MPLLLAPPDYSRPIPGAPHFTLAEMTFSDSARKLGLENIPGEEELANLCHLAREVLEPLRRDRGPIRVSSGFRGPGLNWFISTSRESGHCRGEAADILPLAAGVTCLDLLCYIHRNLNFHLLIAERFPRGWVHVSLSRQGRQARRLLEISPRLGTRAVTLEQLEKAYS